MGSARQTSLDPKQHTKPIYMSASEQLLPISSRSAMH